MEQDFSCVKCGGSFRARLSLAGQRRTNCDACKRERSIAHKAAKRRARGAIQRGTVSQCDRCGADYIVNHHARLFCQPCSEVRRAERFARSERKNKTLRRERGRNHDARRRTNEARRMYMKNYTAKYSARRLAIPRFRLAHRMTEMVRRGLKTKKEGRRWSDMVSFDLDTLIVHLERQFSEGMSWTKYG